MKRTKVIARLEKLESELYEAREMSRNIPGIDTHMSRGIVIGLEIAAENIRYEITKIEENK